MIQQVSSYMLANIVSAMFGFASVVIFTRVLGPEEYGVYIVGFSIAAMISALLFGWIKSSVVPFTANDKAPDIRFTAGVAFAGLTLLIPVIYFGIGAFLPQYSDYLLPAILLAFGIGFLEFYLEIFRASQRTSAFAWATILRAAFALVFALLLVTLLHLAGIGLLMGVMLSYFAAILAYSAFIWRGPLAPFDPGMLRAMLRFGLPMTLSGTVFVLQTMLDRFVLAGSLGEHAAGLYGAAADLVRQILLFPGVAIGTAVAPIAVRLLARSDHPALDKHLVESTELLLGVLAPAVAGLAIIAAKLAALVLGEEFRADAATLIPIIALAWLFRSASYQLLHVSFQMRRLPSLMLLQGLLILAINAVALVVLVPRFGLLGAAWAMLISEAIGVVIGYILSRRAYPLPLDWRSLGKVGLATLGMVIPTYAVDQLLPGTDLIALLAPVLVGVVSYGACAYLLDLAQIRSRLSAGKLRAA